MALQIPVGHIHLVARHCNYKVGIVAMLVIRIVEHKKMNVKVAFPFKQFTVEAVLACGYYYAVGSQTACVTYAFFLFHRMVQLVFVGWVVFHRPAIHCCAVVESVFIAKTDEFPIAAKVFYLHSEIRHGCW